MFFGNRLLGNWGGLSLRGSAVGILLGRTGLVQLRGRPVQRSSFDRGHSQ